MGERSIGARLAKGSGEPGARSAVVRGKNRHKAVDAAVRGLYNARLLRQEPTAIRKLKTVDGLTKVSKYAASKQPSWFRDAQQNKLL